MTPAIGVAPYRLRPGTALARTPLSELEFPLGLAQTLQGGCLGDLGRDDHVVFMPKSSFYLPRPIGIAARPSLVIPEPRAVHGWHMRLIRLYHRRFFRILTRDRQLLSRIPNGIFHSHMFSFIARPDQVDTAKTRTCSLIASAKTDHEGHRLRHAIIAAARAERLDLDVLGRGYAPFTDKAEGLAPYRYSVVIENSREQSYISEKLLDAFLCGTIPIYWGAPDVADWFDPRGMIVAESENDIMAALRTLPDRDPLDFAAALGRNRETARDLAQGNLRVAEKIRDALTS